MIYVADNFVSIIHPKNQRQQVPKRKEDRYNTEDYQRNQEKGFGRTVHMSVLLIVLE